MRGKLRGRRTEPSGRDHAGIKGVLGRFAIAAALLVALIAVPLSANATHSWNGYHWERSSNPVTLELGDNVTSKWDGHLALASSDWSLSSVLDTVVAAGKAKANCRPSKGRVEICDDRYGYNGWLGVATVWVKGGHIEQSTVKVNDSYFDDFAQYNTSAWRQTVMCQEIGHAFGLTHQDEDFYNTPLGTCMDYSADPTLNQHPNQHDYDQLEAIYAHLDAADTGDGGGKGNGPPPGRGKGNNGEPSEFGKLVSGSKKAGVSVHEIDLGNGQKVFNFVTWAK